MTNNLSPSIPDIVEYQLPESVAQPENARFVAMLRHYYDWLVQEGQPTDFIHNLVSYRDIDLTNDAFRQHLTASLLDAIPAYSKADRTLLTKHITEFLRSKGSFESFQFIMNAIYGEEIEQEWNSDKLFRASANEYARTATLTIESQAAWTLVTGSEIVQTQPTPASAIINSSVSTVFDGTHLNWLQLDDHSVVGTFVPGGSVQVLHNTVDRTWYYEEEYYTPISLINGELSFLAATEEKRAYENLIVKQVGSSFRAVVSSFVSRYQETGRTRVNLMLKGVTGTFVDGNEIYIFAPALESILFTKESYEYGTVSNAIVDVDVTNRGSLYDPGDRLTFLDGSGQLVDGYVGEVTSGGVDSVNIIRKGYGYSVGDQLRTIDENTGGQGAVVVVDAVDGIDGAISATTELNSVSIVDGGSGFAVNDEFEVAGGTLVPGTPPARLRVTSVTSSWLFKGVSVSKAGTAYPKYTKIALIDTGTMTKVAGFAASPSFNSNGGVSFVIVTSVPTIATAALVVSANGYGATGTVNLVANAVSTITMGSNGTNYVDPVARVVGDGVGAVVIPVMTGDTITSVTVVKGGSGYTTASIVFSERNGFGFVATPLIQNKTASTGTISAVTILERGQYSSVPPCHSASPSVKVGSGVGATFSMDFRLKSVGVDDVGHYYKAISASVSGKGTGAQLVGTISDGVISSLNKVSGGSGYTHAYVFVAGGLGFLGHASIVLGAVDSIVVQQGGSGYSTSNVVTIVGDGAGASYDLLGVGNIKDGVLSNVAVFAGGRDYYHGTTVSAPTSAGGAVAASLTPIVVDGVIKSVTTTGGKGYVPADLANITINSGTQPTVTATVSGNGGIVGYDTLDAGSGYWSQYEVTPISITTAVAGTGAVFLPTIDSLGQIVKVDVLDGGSGYTLSSTMSVSGGGGTGASLTPVVFGGRITDVRIVDAGVGYRYGTSVIIIGDGVNGAITPVVETGITSAEVMSGGSNYIDGSTVVTVIDPTGTGAEIRPTIVDGAITALTIVKKGSGYTDPTLSASIGSGANLTAAAKRFISSLNVTKKGSGYTYADLFVLGDGTEADFNPIIEKMGSIDAASVGVAGSGITSTPAVVLTDGSGYGAVSRLRIAANGAGYNRPPILVLDNRYDGIGNVTATGTKFTCYGTNMGGVRKVLFDNHGARYDEAPTPIFSVVATLSENAAFIPGETVTVKSGTYRDVAATNYTLMESGGRILLESGDLLVLDLDSTFYDDGLVATVEEFDFDRNIIELESNSDVFYIVTEDGKIMISEDDVTMVDQLSGSFDVGDIIVGSRSGGHATISFLNRASGRAVKGGNGWSDFKFVSEVGKLNNKLSVIEDNHRYQDYAYVIKAGLALKDYERLLKDTVHPSGFSLFGDVVTHTRTDMNILNEIEYNIIVTILYIVSIHSLYQSGSEWSEMTDIFGDFAKFNFTYMPVSLIKDYHIQQVSRTVFQSYLEYRGAPIVDPDFAVWNVINGGQIIEDVGTAPDGSNKIDRLADTTTLFVSGFSKQVSCSIGDTITAETFIKKQVNHQTYCQIALGSDYINFNPETGAHSESNPSAVLDVTSIADYWYVRVKTVATTTNPNVAVYPSIGFVSTFGSSNIGATGSIDAVPVVVKNVTGLTPYSARLTAVNSQYVPHKFYLLDSESQITITP